MDADVLDRFSAATASWFRSNFDAPTAAQAGAWQQISAGRHTLVVAPTGSGKTLSAFLWALDRLAAQPPPEDPLRRCRVLYVSPLKALAVDVERNLRSPLVGIGHAAQRLGLPRPQLSVAVRSGDTPASERRSFARQPSDILITTPESLFLLLTSAARGSLAGVETVIIDEIHALAGTKRGAHLALSLERLDALLEAPAQRIGLSATVRPIEAVAGFLAGPREVCVVNPPAHKQWDLRVVVPVADLAAIDQPSGGPAADLSGPAAAGPVSGGGPYRSPAAAGARAGTPPSDPVRMSSIWPHVEERILAEILAHRSTLVFVNSRRLAERLTARLNELWAERPADDAGGAPRTPGGFRPPQPGADAGSALGRPLPGPPVVLAPAQEMAQSAISYGAPAALVRAHHGSVSREQRRQTEEDLKAGRLAAVVATSSLELGIDMGAIDLVIQVESPPSVASGLQRVGRAGHQVGAVSSAVLFPKFRGDLVQTTVAVERMRAGAIESLHLPANPLDVLAQQIVAMVALDDWTVPDLLALARRAAPFATLSPAVLESVLDMLAGRYPSDEFAELRPRLVWDRATDLLSGRRGAQRLAVTSGGTIPDRGLFGVFLAGAEGPGRRVGELDEEMVYESRVGDVIALGTSSWRIEQITADRVLVSPAPGQAARLPFWKGDSFGRPAEFGAAVGGFLRELSALSPSAATQRLRAAGLDEWAADNLLAYLAEQVEATGRLPNDRQLVIERFRDELGDWRVVVHSPFGARVHAPWALVASARLRQRYGVDVQAMPADDGLVFRLPDTDWASEDTGSRAGSDLPDLIEAIFPDPDDVATAITDQLGGSALFAARFRECASRALLLPKRRPDKRQALWQQRQRAAQLLEVAAGYPSFPIVLEAVRECVNDVFDVPALVSLLRDVQSRKVTTVAVETAHASPFAGSLLFGYVAQFLYEGDSPLAERRAAALALDPSLLAELLGTTEGLALADLLDPDALTRTEDELQHRELQRRARDADELTDLLRALGPLTTAGLQARCRSPLSVPEWLVELAAALRVFEVPGRGWAVAEDAGRLRDALGVALPLGLPQAFTEPLADPLGELLARYARTHTVFTAAEVAAHLGLGVAVVRDGLRRLVAAERLVTGDLRPPGWTPPGDPAPDAAAAAGGGGGAQYCDARVLRLLRRRSLAALRTAVEPVTAADFAGFLPEWQELGRLRGVDGTLRAVEQLTGVPVPASALESLILPSRVVDYRPGMLDELLAAGEVLWQGNGELAGNDGWLSLHLADIAPLTLDPGDLPAAAPSAEARQRDRVGPLGTASRQTGVPSGTDSADGPNGPAGESAAADAAPSEALLAALADGGHFFGTLAGRLELPEGELSRLLWQLVWAGRVTNDTFAPVRAVLGAGHTAHRSRPATARGRYRSSLRLARPLPARGGDPRTAGRWSALPPVELDPTARAVTRAELLLDRYGVVTRGSVAAESVPGGFAAIYKVLAAAEESGRVRRGYFVEGLGAAQFGAVGAVDRLRASSRPLAADPTGAALVLAATDPANPYGAALPWPSRPEGGHLPGRKAGALVVLVDGGLVLYVERGGRTLLSWTQDSALLGPAATALAAAVHAGALGKLTVTKADGVSVLGPSTTLATALTAAGFGLTPSGLRLRR